MRVTEERDQRARPFPFPPLPFSPLPTLNIPPLMGERGREVRVSGDGVSYGRKGRAKGLVKRVLCIRVGVVASTIRFWHCGA
jgi:hypothetical protein